MGNKRWEQEGSECQLADGEKGTVWGWEGIPVFERACEYKEGYNTQPSPIAIYIPDYGSTTLCWLFKVIIFHVSCTKVQEWERVCLTHL